MNENNFDITSWLKVFQERLISLFGNRIKFFGLQGSYGRGEQTADSDIDVVIILDEVNFKDLQNYQSMLDSFDEHDMICGFVSGERELINWEKSDLLQLVLDTKPTGSYISSMKLLSEHVTDKDRTILNIASADFQENDFTKRSHILIEWASEIITEYHG